jgi:aspergillopepsin I
MVAASKLLIATAAAGALAAPTLESRAAKTFSVPAVHNDNYHRNGTLALLKAYAKYNLTPTHPDNVLNNLLGLVKRQDGSVPAKPDSNDVEYVCEVSIGGQTLNLDFDTGSADL